MTLEPNMIQLDIDPIDDCLDQLADLGEFWKKNRDLGRAPNAIRGAILLTLDEIRVHQMATEGFHAVPEAPDPCLKFTRRCPTVEGWYWLRGKLKEDLMVHAYVENWRSWGNATLSRRIVFHDGLELWPDSDPQMDGYEFAGPIPAGV